MDFASLSDMQSIQGGLDPSGATGGVAPSRQDQDNYAQATANILAEPIVGRSRSNVKDLKNYDPAFAAALKISRGLNPGSDSPLTVPSYLQPQLEGKYGPIGPKYYSPVERFLQEDLTDAIRSAQESGLGIPSLLSSGLNAIKSVFDGVSFLNDSKAGKTVEEAAEDEKRKEGLDPLQTDMTDPSFIPRPKETVTKTALAPLFGDVDKTTAMDAGASLAANPNIVMTPEIDALRQDIANNRGIFSLAQADNLQNQQIAAGEKTGQSLVDAPPPPPRKSDVFPMSAGFILSQLSSDPTFTPTVNPRDNPRDPNNPGGTTLTMPDSVKDSAEAPPGFVDITLREGKTPTYAGTNMTIFGGRDPLAKLYSPLTDAEARATTDAGFSLEPISQDLTGSTGGSGLTAVNLPGANFRAVRDDDPDPVVRVPISSLPKQAQQVAALRSGELDYGPSFPLQSILDAKRQKEIRESQEDFQKFMKSLPPIRVGGGYRGPQIDVAPSYAKNFPLSLSPLY